MIRNAHRIDCRSAALAVLAAASLFAACGGERERAGAAAARRAGGRVSALDVSLATGKPGYGPREPITLTLNVRNPTDRPITLRFGSGQRYDFVIETPRGAPVWRWAADRAFAQAVGEQVVPPGWELNYNARVAGGLAPGTYRVRGIITALEDSLESRVEITVRQ